MINIATLKRMASIALVGGVAYWYWSGPYQAQLNPDGEAQIRENNRKMTDCIRGNSYIHGATGGGSPVDRVIEDCAAKHKVHKVGKDWHSYKPEELEDGH